jgi:hypothetical protein
VHDDVNIPALGMAMTEACSRAGTSNVAAGSGDRLPERTDPAGFRPHSPVPQSPVLLEAYVPDSAKVEAAVHSLVARG